MLKTKEKIIFDIPNDNKLQITINCKFSLIYNIDLANMKTVQTRDIVVQVILGTSFSRKT